MKVSINCKIAPWERKQHLKEFMKPADILSRNHDIHMHSRDFSDGSHPVMDVVQFAARWQDSPRWVGLSDHSPQEEDQLLLYIHKLSSCKQELLDQEGITLLTGIELEWNSTGLVCGKLPLTGLDYVIAAYHGGKFSTAGQAEMYYELVTHHPYSDVIAHPDRFLGSVDTLSIGWEKVFNGCSSRAVICEYNLTTPLHPEILAIAIDNTDVNFVIATDTHDFRSLAVRRVIDAWSEMLGGGYEPAREYLISLLKMTCSAAQTRNLARLFETRQLLDGLQNKLYLRSLNSSENAILLAPEEERLIQTLEDFPECTIDKDFLFQRLDRFSSLPAERIVSLLKEGEFKNAVSARAAKKGAAQPAGSEHEIKPG